MASVVTLWVQTQSVLTTTKAGLGVVGVQLLLDCPHATIESASSVMVTLKGGFVIAAPLLVTVEGRRVTVDLDAAQLSVRQQVRAFAAGVPMERSKSCGA